MGLQARMSQTDPRLYNVSRDVAHCFGDVMREVAARFDDSRWDVLENYLKDMRVTDDELGKAITAMCVFVQTATELPKERMGEALVRSGWYAVSASAHVAVCSMIGTVMLGYFYAGVKEATLQGHGPCQTYQDLRQAGEQCHRLITMPRWRRFLLNLKLRVADAYKALRGQK